MKKTTKAYGPRGFIPPDRNQRTAAVALSRLQAAKDPQSRRLCAYLTEAIDDIDAFPPIRAPLPGQWLSDNYEAGQPVKQYVKSGVRRTAKGRLAGAGHGSNVGVRDTIYLLPLGEFEKERSPCLEQLRRFGEMYLCMAVALLPGLRLRPATGDGSSPDGGDRLLQVDFPEDHPSRSAAAREQRIRWRTHYQHAQRKQLSTRDIHDLLRFLLPSDGFCVIALVMEDLFPTDSPMSYVAGEADISRRSGVFSFARFHPDFFTDEPVLRALSSAERAVQLRRSCKLMVHELLHLFGIAHCIHYMCIMNGTKGLGEGSGKPTHLCPCCLHKMFIFRQQAGGFDVEQRYEALQTFFEEHADGFAPELEWTINELRRAAQL